MHFSVDSDRLKLSIFVHLVMHSYTQYTDSEYGDLMTDGGTNANDDVAAVCKAPLIT
jgi:hypothetical protein